MGRGWVGRDAVSIRPGDYPPSFPPANRRHCPGRLFESTDQRNPMYTVGGTKSAVDQRLISGTGCALRSWLLNSVPAPICLCKPFSCKACPGTGIPDSQMSDSRPIVVRFCLSKESFLQAAGCIRLAKRVSMMHLISILLSLHGVTMKQEDLP